MPLKAMYKNKVWHVPATEITIYSITSLNISMSLFSSSISNDFQETRKRLGSVDIALIPIGAYEPRWFMKNNHLNPYEAILVAKDLKAKKSIAMHWGTFALSDEAILDPKKKLKKELKKLEMSPDFFIIPRPGDIVRFFYDTKNYVLKKSFNNNLKVIFASRLLKDKGINEFIELAKSLKGSNMEFFIAGDIDLGNPESLSFNELENLKKLDYVNYLGFVNIENEIHKYDVLVSLSAHEGFSRILLESSFVGLYVVSFENSGTKFISELENSKLISNLNIDSFKEVLENLQETKLALSTKNRDLIERDYSSNEIAKQFNNIYKSI